MRKTQLDYWHFSGDEEMNTTVSAVADASSSYPEIKEGVVKFTSTDHGYKQSPQLYYPPASKPHNLIYIKGTANYDGLHAIVNQDPDSDSNAFQVIAPYVAETLGPDTACPGFKFDHAVEFVGFNLHLSSACGTAENLVFLVDSNRGAAWDRTLYTVAMNTVVNTMVNFAEISTVDRFIEPNDVVYVTYANTDNRTWGLTLITRRMA